MKSLSVSLVVLWFQLSCKFGKFLGIHMLYVKLLLIQANSRNTDDLISSYGTEVYEQPFWGVNIHIHLVLFV